MGYPQRPDVDSRFVAHGILYVYSALAFIGLAVSIGATLGSRLPVHGIIPYGMTGIAMIFLLTGFFLLASFFFRRVVLRSTRGFSGKTDRYDGVWDEQLDG